MRGWLDKAAHVFTFGYYPRDPLVQGKLCIGDIVISIPSMAATFTLPEFVTAMSIPSADVAMTIPSSSTTMTLPSMAIEIEDCP